MPTDPIQPIIDSVKAMENAFVQPSCNSNDPFIKYPSTGTAPVIDFNVPQTTAFTTYGYLAKYFPPEVFKAFTKQAPTNNYFNTVKNMTADQATEMFQAQPIRVTGNLQSVQNPDPFLQNPGIRTVAGYSPYIANMMNHTAARGAEGTELSTPTSADSTVAGTSIRPGLVTSVINRADIMQNSSKMVPAASLFVKTSAVRPDLAVKQIRPLLVTRFAGQAPVTKYVAVPPVPVPRLIVVEEYTTVSYLGNYGAGKTVKTFSLLPGERTTISVRTYKDKVTTASAAKNVLDSMSTESATELDTLMQHEQGDMSSTSDTSGGSGSSFAANTDTQNSSKSFGISGGLHFGPISIGGGYGKSQSETSTSSGGSSSAYDYNHTGVRQSNINALDSAMNKHVQQSNAARQIDVNTTTSDSTASGEENVTVRELKNVNLNNTLNFVFRQLLQEYTTITYVSNLKFVYTNGYPETYTMVDLCNLPNMLLDIIDTTLPDTMNNVLCKLLNPYCSVMNYNDEFKQFVEKITVPNSDCLQIGGNCSKTNESIYRIKKDCIDTYNEAPLDVRVHGVILSVKKQTLQTSSTYVDAMLGRGDALDCFNQKAQNAENIGAYISNLTAMQQLEDSMQTTANNQQFSDQQIAMSEQQIALSVQQQAVVSQQMDVISNIPDPADRAAKYKKVFGDCCDVAQSGGCCTCNDHDEKPAV